MRLVHVGLASCFGNKEDIRKRALVMRFNEIYPEGLPEGSLLMDAPCDNVSELAELAGDHGDHTEWNLIVRALEQRLGVGKPAH